MSNEQHEDKSLACRIRGCSEVLASAPERRTQASRRDRVQGATWLCRIHRAAVRFTDYERQQLRGVEGMILQGQLALADDGWLTPIAPTPRPPQPIYYDDDGTPRYRDMSSPFGLTVRPEVDTLIGDDPRLNKYRDEADDGTD
ncbi:MAG: hypothetical protein WB677_01145 [Xanthobacteraceae bacterium]